MLAPGDRSATDNRRVVLAFFTHLASGRTDEAVALLADDLYFWMPARREEIGRAETATRLARVGALMDGAVVPFDVTDTVAEGDRVTALVEVHAALRDGTAYDQYYHWWFRLRDGRIVQMREYNDTALVHRLGIVPPGQPVGDG